MFNLQYIQYADLEIMLTADDEVYIPSKLSPMVALDSPSAFLAVTL